MRLNLYTGCTYISKSRVVYQYSFYISIYLPLLCSKVFLYRICAPGTHTPHHDNKVATNSNMSSSLFPIFFRSFTITCHTCPCLNATTAQLSTTSCWYSLMPCSFSNLYHHNQISPESASSTDASDTVLNGNVRPNRFEGKEHKNHLTTNT